MADGWIQLRTTDFENHDGVEELNRMLKFLFDSVAGDGLGLKVYSDYGVPSITADNGSLYLRKDGGSGTTLYVRESGSWVGK